jgi:hypothetical protein
MSYSTNRISNYVQENVNIAAYSVQVKDARCPRVINSQLHQRLRSIIYYLQQKISIVWDIANPASSKVSKFSFE